MTPKGTTIEVRRLTPRVVEIAVAGEVTSASEGQFIEAHVRASADGTRVIVLDFGGLDYMNSGGIGLLVTLLIRTQRHDQRLMAVGLSDHYRQILALTRLDESIEIHPTRSDALAAAGT